MSYPILQSSTSYPLLFLMVDSADHITPKTGLSPTVTLSKNGGSFASPSGAVSEIANGWYKVAGNATDSATLGPLVLHATSAGADPTDATFAVVADDPYLAKPANWVSMSIDGSGRVDVAKVAGTSQTAGDIFARIGVPAGASVSADIASIKTDTGTTIPGRLPAALVSGRMDSNIGAMASGVLTASAIAADAITDAKVASDVTIASVTGAVGSVTGAVGSVTGNVGGNVTGSVGSVVGAVGSVTGNVGGNVTGSVGSVAAGGIASTSFAAGAITASAIAADAIGASELATDAVAEIAGAVWDITLSGHVNSGTTGYALNAAGAAGDPWSTAIPGAYSAGTAGYIVGTNVNATVSSRLATNGYTAPLDAAGTRSAVGLAIANLDTQLDALPTATENADALLKRDWTSVTGEAARSLLNALRFLRNKWTNSAGTLTVMKEDDSTTAWTATTATTAGDPVSSVDPS